MPESRHERIERRAYEIWERDGRPHGREEEHWRQAAAEIDAEDLPAPVPVAGEPGGAPKAKAEPARSRSAAASGSAGTAKAADDAPGGKPRAKPRARTKPGNAAEKR